MLLWTRARTPHCIKLIRKLYRSCFFSAGCIACSDYLSSHLRGTVSVSKPQRPSQKQVINYITMQSLSSQIVSHAEVLYTSCCAYMCKCVYWRHWRAGPAANQQRHVIVKATMKEKINLFFFRFY